MTKALAVDWADRGILVNAIAPGYIATRLTEPLLNDPQFDAWVKQRCPLGRWGTPEDIGRAVAAIAQDLLPFSTGEVLNVDGGFHLRRL